eukprot:TRINITY_DN16737_c0_g1_i1.p1 TRINITY_DN16737_c0_g1~~TRINITY_DN16737_c0_g1_i1.p1  ORF type:complete len:348 (-),score=69.09 TRINITY_DN16737_c0_g1_i1:258-1301(-)
MPSSGRPDTARLDLTEPMQQATRTEDWCYVQIVFVKDKEYEQYRQHWPQLNFFALPPQADELGIGAARFAMLALGRLICPDEFRIVMTMDDNVQAWKAVSMGPSDDTFANLGFPLEEFKDQRKGPKKDVPLGAVLRYFQEPDFREQLCKFGVLGFDRFGRREKPLAHPYARRHVYKALLINLDVVQTITYKWNARVWEDVEFNLRISGRQRQDNGGSSGLDKQAALSQQEGGVWIDQDSKLANGEPILGQDDPEGPAVIVKCYRFQYMPAQCRRGGCAGEVLRPVDETPAASIFAGLAEIENKLFGEAGVNHKDLLGRLDKAEMRLFGEKKQSLPAESRVAELEGAM